MDLVVGCGFGLLTGICLTLGKLEKVKLYAKISASIYEKLGEKQHPFCTHVLLQHALCESKVSSVMIF